MILRTALLIFCFSLLHPVAAQSFDIAFKQNNQLIQPDSLGRIFLKKDTFVIETTLKKLDGVFVNSSYDSVVYQGVLQRTISDFQTIGWKVGVETEFNKDQELLMHDQYSYCYWFYSPKEYDWHRFDSVIVRKGSTIIGTKTIRQLYFSENKQNIAIKDLPKKPIYLSFFSTSGSIAKENAKLEQVQCFRLYFED